MCLRRARALGQLRNNKDGCHGNKDKWCGVVDVKVLQQALVCRDEQVRERMFPQHILTINFMRNGGLLYNSIFGG